MKFRPVRFGLARSLVALAVSFALILSTHILAFASPANSATQTDSSQHELQLTSATATASATGVLLHWSTNSTADNVGFNVYRIKDGRRTRVNRKIIPGALFAPGTPALRRAGYSYSWFDRGGTPDSTYFIESVSVEGSSKIHGAISPLVSKTVPGFEQTPEALSGGDASAPESTDMFETKYPAAETQLNSPQGAIQEQWPIAAQTGLKIAIKKDGWYRVTQQQMVTAGFNPTVDIRNLRLFVDANEVAIITNQLTGPFGSGDFIEFYGRGLDIPTTDTRTYYLIAGTTPGKRVLGEIQLDSPPLDPPSPPGPTSTPPPPVTPPVVPASTPITPLTPTSTGPVLRDPIFYSRWLVNDISWLVDLNPRNSPVKPETKENDSRAGNSEIVNAPYDESQAVGSPGDAQPAASYSPEPEIAGRGTKDQSATPRNVVRDAVASNNTAPKANMLAPGSANNTRSLPLTVLTRTAGKFRKSPGTRKKTRRKLRRQLRQERNHALTADGFAPANFDYTVEIKDRSVYLANLLNGDAENWFGAVIAGSPVTQTLTISNPDLSAIGPARLEFALQGVMSQSGASHQVTVTFNDTTIASLTFFGLEHPVQAVSIPVAQLQSGANTLKFTKTSTGEVCIVDYVRFTYPHAYKADSGSLKFNLRGSQTLKVDGFSTSSVRLIDYTDPLAVSITRPSSEPSASGYAVTVPMSESRSKDQRLLYAIPEGQFDQPAALSLNQPSTLNLNSNAADFLIISHKTFIPSFTANVSPINTSLVAQRQSQGFSVSVVDVDDVYDEFSYGVHGPQAIRDFLQHAATNWNNGTAAPRYIVFAGDASLDPRNYQGVGNFDLVPTKLVDATFNETCSDDWLTDFDNDGVADIPVGRLPFRTVADANLLISKIVNFTPVTPQSAMLVADDPTGYYFNFEDSSDEVAQILLPAGVTVQKAYRRLEVKILTGTISTDSSSNSVTGSGTLFTTPTEIPVGTAIAKPTGERLGTVASISSATSLTLTANATSTYAGAYGKQDNATAKAHIIDGFNQGRALVNYTGHGNVDVWTGAAIFTANDALALTNGNVNKFSFVVVMDCLNGYFQDPVLLSLSEALIKAPNGGAVAAFASSGLTFPDGQHEMAEQLYTLLYGAQPIALGDAIKGAKNATFDIDVRRTWIFFGDPSIKIR